MDRFKAWLDRAWAKTKVVATSWPGIAAGATVILTGLTVELVPHLPGPWPVRLGGFLAGAAAVIRIVSAVVAVVTPVLFPQNKGLLAPPPAQSPGPQFMRQPSHVSIHEPAGPPLPPVDPSAYPPGSERLPHRRIQ